MRPAWLVAVVGASALVAACDPDPFTMVVNVRGSELVVYRDGDGDWKPVEPGVTGKARIRIESGRYSLVWACGSSEWHVIHSTIGDEPQASCIPGNGAPLVQLSGATTLFATISVGVGDAQGSSTGRYSFGLEPGFYDVLALSASEPVRMMLEHDVDVRTSRELDLLVENDGVPLETAEPLITGSPQAITLTSRLYTRNRGTFVLPAIGEVAYVAPPSMLVDTDWQVVQADSETGCSSSVRVDGSDLHIEVPDRPELRVETRRVWWSSSEDWRYMHLEVDRRVFVSATRDWMEAQDVTDVEIPDLARLPGVNGQIGLHPDEPVGWTFYVERGHPSSKFAWCRFRDFDP